MLEWTRPIYDTRLPPGELHDEVHCSFRYCTDGLGVADILVARCGLLRRAELSGGQRPKFRDRGRSLFKTIQPAVDAAKSGDTIYVKAGVYSDIVNIRGFGRPTHPDHADGVGRGRPGRCRLRARSTFHRRISGRPIDGPDKSYQVQFRPERTPGDRCVILDGKAHRDGGQGRNPAQRRRPELGR